MDVLVVAKAPTPGRVKTRLCPPCTPVQAAGLAEAALADTLAAARGTGADRVLLALDGPRGPWLPPGILVVDQGAGSFDLRLARAWSHVEAAALQVGMDTPQVSSSALDAAMATLLRPGVDAVFGPADDGGWWAIGMRPPEPAVFEGVPTGRHDTGARQRHRLLERGRCVATLPTYRDVDTYADIAPVAALAPDGRFARAAELVIGVA